MRSETAGKALAAIVAIALMGSSAALAGCAPWSWCQVENKAHEVGEGVKQAATGVAQGAAAVVTGGVKILRGAAELATGHPGQAWASVVEGGKEMVNGVVQIVVTGSVTAITMADPLIGTVFFGTPSPLQGFTKFLYETISRWKGKPHCNPPEQLGRLMTVPKRSLDDASRLLGAVSTPAKYLSSIFDGYGAWEATGCDAVGTGRPVRDAQISTDGLWTVDVAISTLDIENQRASPGRYIRLEVFPDTDAHESVVRRKPTPGDVIRFRGPLVWDKDTDGDHPHGHMQMHPIVEIEFGVSDVKNVRSDPGPSSLPQPGDGTSTTPIRPSVVPPGPAEYEVRKGDNLSRIAEHLYGEQRWPRVFCANRKMIRNPDLIFPGQRFQLPITPDEVGRARCSVPLRRG